MTGRQNNSIQTWFFMSVQAKKKDIKKPQHVQKLMIAFFARLKTDPVLGPYFNQYAHTDWDAFLQVMCRFWENILFYSGGYVGNPLERHRELHAFQHFTTALFDRWLALLNQTVDEQFAGDNAELLKNRAANIAKVMQVKVLN